MALSRGMNQEASQDTDLGLLDATLMQNLQDRFCDANNVYLVCLSRTRGVVTKAYGSKVHSRTDRSGTAYDAHEPAFR